MRSLKLPKRGAGSNRSKCCLLVAAIVLFVIISLGLLRSSSSSASDTDKPRRDSRSLWEYAFGDSQSDKSTPGRIGHTWQHSQVCALRKLFSVCGLVDLSLLFQACSHSKRGPGHNFKWSHQNCEHFGAQRADQVVHNLMFIKTTCSRLKAVFHVTAYAIATVVYPAGECASPCNNIGIELPCLWTLFNLAGSVQLRCYVWVAEQSKSALIVPESELSDSRPVPDFLQADLGLDRLCTGSRSSCTGVVRALRLPQGRASGQFGVLPAAWTGGRRRQHIPHPWQGPGETVTHFITVTFITAIRLSYEYTDLDQLHPLAAYN